MSADDAWFPVLLGSQQKEADALGCPRNVPWALLAPHEDWARANHDQSLGRLAQRGGLDPTEMVAILERRKWRMMGLPDAVARLREFVAQYRDAAGKASP